jgi:PAS domain S-box-containing protein
MHALYQCDVQGKCTYVNDKLCELFDITKEQALNMGWMDRIHPEDRERVTLRRSEALAPVSTFHLRYRIMVRGTVKWVHAFSTALMQGGIFAGRSGILIEVEGPPREDNSP